MTVYLTPHFKRSELECQCGCGAMLFSDVALQALEDLRIRYGKPMRISSGYRCPSHNELVSSTRSLTGPHTRYDGNNITVDVLVFGANLRWLTALAIMQGWTGIGWHQKGPHEKRFLHLDRLVDCGTRPTGWSY